MGTLTLRYALPVSRIRVDGTLTVTKDAVTSTTEKTPEVTVALEVCAKERNQTLQFHTGWIFNTAVGLELTDDGRLVSSDLESTGQLGKVVLGVVGAGAAVAGVVMNPAALAGAAIHGALRTATTAEDRQEIEQRPPVDPAILEYRKTHEDLDDLRKKYEAIVEKAVRRVGELGSLIVDEPDASKRWGHISELRQLQSVMPSLEAELDRLVQHFKTWRASKITTRSEAYERCFDLDALRQAGVVVEGEQVSFSEGADETVKLSWQELGVRTRFFLVKIY